MCQSFGIWATDARNISGTRDYCWFKLTSVKISTLDTTDLSVGFQLTPSTVLTCIWLYNCNIGLTTGLFSLYRYASSKDLLDMKYEGKEVREAFFYTKGIIVTMVTPQGG